MSNQTIIISDLAKEDFLGNVSLVDRIKLAVLRENDEISHVAHWSNLPTLNRVIIIFTEASHAEKALARLKEEFPHLNLSLQENLLARSKSAEQLAAVVPEKNDREPAPAKANLSIKTDSKYTQTLYSPTEPQSPTITLNSF